ncbi:EmrB/QacA subfamily drug resistance transporter [Streptomyces sp. V4I23]|uniref:MFS transporter n=1 Tax=Streptomyces sp. V4I23 TaxID=3042282 RepID=UPI0027866DF3|nr:MFS transporter [Streptomyces sp. V4I23]MDQ1008556.1 EmrB/QacA subfamily drug resistance transporter [Streptomyces sp. V4I23]
MNVVPSAEHPGPTPGWTVAVVACAAQFMVVLDTTIVNVALPSMREDLGLGAEGQQWVVNAYLLTFAGFLMLGGRAADLFGRRRMFTAGLVLFTAASLLGGLATGGGLLIAARTLQGLGAAFLAPAPLALINATYRDVQARTKAIAAWGATATAAGSCGILLGGVLTDALGWRWVLFVNVPIGAVLVAVALRALPASGGRARGRALDVPGAVLVTAALAGAAYGLSELETRPLSSLPTGGVLAVAVVLLAAFVTVEARSAQPLMPLRILRSRALVLGNAAALVIGAVTTSVMFFVTLYLQRVLGYEPLQAGLAMLPLTLAIAVASLLVRRVVQAMGPRLPLALGWLLTAGGLLWQSRFAPDGSFGVDILGPGILLGLGLGTVVLPMTAAATSGVAAEDAGLASALMNTARQMGGGLGLAVLSAVAGTATGTAALTHGYAKALLVATVLSLVAGALALFMPRRAAAAAPAAVPGDEPGQRPAPVAAEPAE